MAYCHIFNHRLTNSSSEPSSAKQPIRPIWLMPSFTILLADLWIINCQHTHTHHTHTRTHVSVRVHVSEDDIGRNQSSRKLLKVLSIACPDLAYWVSCFEKIGTFVYFSLSFSWILKIQIEARNHFLRFFIFWHQEDYLLSWHIFSPSFFSQLRKRWQPCFPVSSTKSDIHIQRQTCHEILRLVTERVTEVPSLEGASFMLCIRVDLTVYSIGIVCMIFSYPTDPFSV